MFLAHPALARFQRPDRVRPFEPRILVTRIALGIVPGIILNQFSCTTSDRRTSKVPQPTCLLALPTPSSIEHLT